MGLLRAVKVMVSQARGADQLEQTKRYFFAGKALAAVMGVVLLAMTPLIVMGLRQLLDTAESAEAGASYFAIRMFSTPLFLMFVAAREYRYGMGDSRLPMIAGVSANILNVILDYVFIMELGWGVEGAAWATLAGTAPAMLVLMRSLLGLLKQRSQRQKNQSLRPFDKLIDSCLSSTHSVFVMSSPLGLLQEDS